MSRITRTLLKDFNPAVLDEEVAALPIGSFGWAGFVRLDSRTMTPANERRVVSQRTTAAGKETIEADPGELWINTDRDLDANEITTLDTILSTHNATTQSPEQARQDKDDAELTDLHVNYLGRNTQQRETVEGKMLRQLLRRFGGYDV